MVLQLCIANPLYGANLTSYRCSIILCAVILLIAIVSLICYLVYHHLGPVSSFMVGMIPLILIGAMMVAEVDIILHSMPH